jgi:alpha-glucoside transport system permease protein
LLTAAVVVCALIAFILHAIVSLQVRAAGHQRDLAPRPHLVLGDLARRREMLGTDAHRHLAAGNDPVAWLQVPTLNTFALILIMVWLQTGFAMVILSAAIKGLPSEVIEAARIDGARESQIFFRVVVPMIKGSIITVATTICIAILKVFDIVFVMTGGRFETEVLANRMFSEMFRFRNFGVASALAVVLFVAVIPIMVINIRNLRRQGIGS